MEAIVIGAGTFGASLARLLAREGDRVTLVDQLEPGDPAASSGGETRLLRCAHGSDSDYAAMARRAATLWRELEAEAGEELLLQRGMMWFAHREDGWEAESERTLASLGIPVERLGTASAARRFPSLRGDDLAFVLHEPEAGVLRAQRAVRTLASQAAAHGARLVRARARPEGPAAVLDDSTRLEGDAVVWACGGWLARLFPDLVSIRVTRQELLFLDGGAAWREASVPAWCDYDRAMYGTADIDGLGVKAALDREGEPIDPDADLPAAATTEAAVREYLRERFPLLEDAPLVSARSCRYELTPDTHFVAARHPDHAGVWLVGGGSGHGFKHGPAMAERLASAIKTGAELPANWALGGRQPARSLRTAGSGLAG